MESDIFQAKLLRQNYTLKCYEWKRSFDFLLTCGPGVRRPNFVQWVGLCWFQLFTTEAFYLRQRQSKCDCFSHYERLRSGSVARPKIACVLQDMSNLRGLSLWHILSCIASQVGIPYHLHGIRNTHRGLNRMAPRLSPPVQLSIISETAKFSLLFEIGNSNLFRP